MACSLPHTIDEIKALVEKLINEDIVRHKAITELAVQFDNARTTKEDLRKTYEKCNDIPQENCVLIDTFLKQEFDKDYEMHLSLSLLDTAYWTLFFVVSYEVQAQIRRIFLDGYGVLDVRIFRRRLTANGMGLRVADSHNGNHREDDFTPLETIRRFLELIQDNEESFLGGAGDEGSSPFTKSINNEALVNNVEPLTAVHPLELSENISNSGDALSDKEKVTLIDRTIAEKA
ncbi:hypothetical protein Tco_0327026 [Tanacetum coccineum]